MKKIVKYIFLLGIATGSASCEEMLDVTPNSEFAPGNVLTSENGIKALLFSAYAEEQTQQNSRFLINNAEVSTDIGFNSGGGENGQLVHMINFTWDASLGTFQGDVWAPEYRCIRDANGVIENIDNVVTSDANKKLFKAEGRALRANAYMNLYNYFGPVPLRTSTLQVGDFAKATDEEIKAFIEDEFRTAIPDLPLPGQEEAYGRYNKGVAGGLLARFMLNTKQWQKAADASKAVIDLNYYTLFTPYKDLFMVANEQNKEMILVKQCKNEVDYGNWYMAGALPPAYKNSPQFPQYTYLPTMSNFATQYRLRTAFVNSFAANDLRKSLILTSYVNNANATVNIQAGDNARCFKYWDNATIGNNSGNDVPVLRYADILLIRAEALNELSAVPTTECFTLINQVRTRAGLHDLTIATTPTKEAFRDAVLAERGWEFYGEGLRREDLIRHGKFLSSAIARGVSAASATTDKLLFPIPQTEVSANKLLVQNNGY
ncbi:putative outer membrane starch-binding protein [Arcticibacter tournemirensis]|nr:RagB/SusD family nutrient uptake outer membrane protein [Arcticibacter tournemirensis]TQM51673.1 putative outer membrane starch-binding protein [Arcticibacter tournemirensis]